MDLFKIVIYYDLNGRKTKDTIKAGDGMTFEEAIKIRDIFRGGKNIEAIDILKIEEV